MVILRLISIFFIIVALMLFGADVVSALEQTDEMIPRSLAHILMLFGFDAAEWFARNLPPPIAAIGVTLVSWPGWAVIVVPGVVGGLLAAGRSERRPPKPLPPIHR
jgi:hypothetical protein